MDIKKLASQLLLAQSILSASGLTLQKNQMPNVGIRIGYYGAAIIFFFVMGVAMISAGLYFYLSSFMPLYQVLMIMGAGAGGIALLIIAIRLLTFCFIRRKVNKTVSSTIDNVQDIFEEIAEQIEKPIAENPKMAISLAVLAGFILSQKILDR
jgi:NADH:ubiquinone oxidoreductase subunit 6 (subunit J)